MDKWIKGNKITVIVIVLIVLFVIFYFSGLSLKDSITNTAIQDTTNMALQEKCADQALRMFNQAGYKNNELAGQTNHYNKKLNKCFIEIQSTDVNTSSGMIWIYRTLHDAYEGKIYGEYSWHTEKDKKYWEVPPYTCSMYPNGNNKNFRVCETEEEFDDFVKHYMEN